jgi:iron(III) transport system substrate-binding protein
VLVTRRQWLAASAAAMAAGSVRAAAGATEVVVYCALDREFSEPILKDFEKETRIAVQAVYDVESTKSVALAQRILRERNRPRCDVYWNNEILNTLRLERNGLLAADESAAGGEYDKHWRSPANRWYGFAARARVLIVNEKKLAGRKAPERIEELGDPEWKNEVGIAKPLFGTTATHVACLFAKWGAEKTKAWLRKLQSNGVKILSGNKRVAEEVGAGMLTMGLTDTDDAAIEIAAGRSVRQVFLDQEADGLGSLVIPNTLALIEGSPHREAARKLREYLLTPAVEIKLANCPSKQMPLHPKAKVEGVPAPKRPMVVDFARAAEAWDEAMNFVKAEFAG